MSIDIRELVPDAPDTAGGYDHPVTLPKAPMLPHHKLPVVTSYRIKNMAVEGLEQEIQSPEGRLQYQKAPLGGAKSNGLSPPDGTIAHSGEMTTPPPKLLRLIDASRRDVSVGRTTSGPGGYWRP
ncbi:hypothetical protein Bbelb_363730 [Branchiostoma belcheri]|nr:hypothetical protein Bbelb_363730 [Branchiostoma belcheri]